MDVTKEDLNRLYDKLGETNDGLNGLNVTVAELKVAMESRKRPCHYHVALRKEFDAQVKVDKDTKKTWKQAAIKAVVDIVKTLILVGGGLILGTLI